MNYVAIRGRLTADPKSMTVGQNDTMIAGFSIAHNTKRRDGQEITTFVKVKFIGKTAETVVKWLKKGKDILVEGQLEVEKFTTQQGKEVENTIIKGNRFHFLGGKNDSDSGNSNDGNDNQNGGGNQLW